MNFLNIFKTPFLTISLVMLLTWVAYLLTNNPAVVDVSWGLGFSIVAYYFYRRSYYRQPAEIIALILTFVWSLRLSGFLFYTRILNNYKDVRYEDIKNSFSRIESLNFLLNYQLQAIFLILIASIFYFVFLKNTKINLLFYFSILVIIIGIMGEAIADYQLYTFKQIGAKGICDIGLWKYSRHPNYFFEFVVWFGFSLIGFNNSANYLAFFSPLFLFYVINNITLPLTERKSIERRAGYKEYILRTNKYLPLPVLNKKRKNS